MSEPRFIKLIDSEETDYLQEHHPNAFLLLSFIVRRARRSSSPDGLQPGDAIIGELETSKKSGISRKEYRGALNKLIEMGFLEEVYNPKAEKSKVQKRAIKRAIKSKIVNITKSTVYDININDEGDQKGELRAIKGRTEGDKQRIDKNDKNDKKKKKYKKENFLDVGISEFGQHVWFPKTEYQSLVAELGETLVHHFIKEIHQHIESGKPSYDCYAQAVRKWHTNAVAWKTLPPQGTTHGKTTQGHTQPDGQSKPEPRFKARNVIINNGNQDANTG